MTCKECSACTKGYFKSSLNLYVCTGVKYPFVIEDIDGECTEYEDKREDKKNEQYVGTDCLTVTYDCCSPDAPTLCVARKEKDKVRVLNTIQGNQAFGIYCFLTDNAYLMERQGKWILNKDGSGTCGQCRRTAKNVWDYDNYQNYCGHCGAKMSI